MDQYQGGTPPVEFATDLEKLRIVLNRFCNSNGQFAPHATLGRMSRSERMRHAYLHMDHHLRQFGAYRGFARPKTHGQMSGNATSRELVGSRNAVVCEDAATVERAAFYECQFYAMFEIAEGGYA